MRNGIENVYPLSPLQEGLLFHALYAPEIAPYVGQIQCELHGDLDVAAFRRSWELALERHSILRTSFAWKRVERPRQVVHRRVELPLQHEDWRGLSEREQEESWKALLATDERTLDPAHAPLLRLALARTGDRVYRFVWTQHHLVLDGWSQKSLLREIFTSYHAFRRGRATNLPPLRPFSDYLIWLQRQEERAAEAFWRRELAGFTSPTPLGIGITSTVRRGIAGRGRHHGELTAAQTAALTELVRSHELTLNSVLQGAWALLLSLYSGESDVVYGTVVSGRPPELPGIESMIGMFSNTLPTRVEIEPESPLVPWLRRLQARLVEMRVFEHSPLSKVHGWSEVPREVPLFESLLGFENYPLDASGRELAEPDPTLRLHAVRGGENLDHPLVLDLFPGSTLAVRISYDSERFDAPTIQRLLRHLFNLLDGMASDPGRRLIDFPYLTEAEHHQLALEWNDTRLPGWEEEVFPRLFAAQAARTPDAVAAVCEGISLTYAGLAARAAHLARVLAHEGVRPGVVVAALMDRGLDLLTTLIAILEAGGAYLPLDPKHPPQRHAQILAQSEATLLLTGSPYSAAAADAASLAEMGSGLRLRSLEEMCRREPDPATRLAAPGPGDLAYVIFTSGSTGQSKGAMVVQRGMINHLRAKIVSLGATATDVVAQNASQCFDVSVWQYLTLLLVGGRVHVYPDAVAHDQERLLTEVSRDEVSILEVVPSQLRVMLELPSLPPLPALRWMIPNGEVLPPAQCERWLELYPHSRLINAYGPTECSDDVAQHVIDRRPVEVVDHRISIGRPLANLRLYVTDKSQRPLPIGVPGELCIGGIAVGLGYLGSPGRTAEVFIPDPFIDRRQEDAVPGSRLYRTGDLIRRSPDGRLDFLRRIDRQVKIRGVRIEPGEIEAVLCQHAAVSQAVVLVREGERGDKSLVAYLAGLTSSVGDRELRDFLRGRLPDAMVPSAFVRLEEYPLHSNGKIDRRTLARIAPDAADVVDEEESALRTPVQELVAGVWADILGIQRVGPEDNFFEVGGHSLNATRVTSRLKQVLGVEVPLRSLFEAPTVADFAAEIEELLRERHGTSRPAPPLEPVPRGSALPLSFSQLRQWILDRLEPGNPGYNIPAALRLRGPLDTAALERAFDEVVRRHESLRTAFGTADGEPVQIIRPHTGFSLPAVDLGDLPSGRIESEMRRLTAAHASRSFDLERGPLFSAALLHTGSRGHVLVVSLHHIVSDGWSVRVLVRELTRLYAAFTRGEPSPLPELPLQYPDYAVWQRSWLQGEVLDGHVAYWQEALGGLSSTLRLPFDRPRPALQAFDGAERLFRIDAETSDRLWRFSVREGATPFMVLLAALQVLLHRYSGQTDICVGSYTANRTRPEVEDLIGFFVNTLALRTDLAGDPALRETLGRVRQTTLDAYAHQDLPFEKVLEVVKPDRDLSRTPLFQVLLVLQNVPTARAEISDLALEPFQGTREQRANFDLTFWFHEGDDGIRGTLDYSTRLFDEATIARLILHFETLLASALADPERKIALLPLMPDAERQQVLTEWGRGVAAPEECPLPHQLFEARADLVPGAPALVWDGGVMTYAELDAEANRLARRLAALGVGSEVAVALCIERSPALLIALLATHKAGGFYVPLDPAYPSERLALLLADSNARVLLTRERQADRLPAIPGLSRILLDAEAEREALARLSPERLRVRTSPECLAYVIYTSGSTGNPKGVEVTHRSLATFTDTMVATYGLGPRDRCLQLASISFDTSAEEIHPTLASGATLVLPSEVRELLGPALLQRCGEQGVTVLDLPTALWHQLTAEPGFSLPDPVRLVILGGEMALPESLGRWQERVGPTVRLINTYGPTEATIVATSWEVDPRARTLWPGLPIGRPIPGVRVVVVDGNGEPVPTGAPGELCLGGVGLARGYRGRPELTAERFVPDPFASRSGERLYRTGDLARWLPDGSLTFLGRIDEQVKVRGYRIEPGEVEAHLVQLPGVREAAVVARERPGGGLRLVACLALDEGASAAEVAELLRQRLPGYMIPAVWVTLPALPLTPNGKVDRRALPPPAPSPSEGAGEASSVPGPGGGSIEQILADIWKRVLGSESAAPQDDFFARGGDSLLAMQLVSQVRQVFRVEVPLRRIFEGPTMAALAAEIERELAGGTLAPEPPLQRVPGDDGLPLSFAQERLWFLDQLLPGNIAYNLRLPVRLKGPLRIDALQGALAALVERHESLRTRFTAMDGDPVQVILPAGPVPLPVIDLAGLPGDRAEAELQRLASDEGRRPFDLVRGPLLRAGLVRMEPGEHVFLLNLHHIVTDEWSMVIFVREMALLYLATAAGLPPRLPELPIRYADFAAWQRAWMTGDVLAAQLAYWKGRLADSPRILELPTDRPRPAAPATRAGTRTFLLPATLGDALRELARREGVTLFMSLLASLAALLQRHTGQEDLAIGSPVANRNRAETAGLIGFFVNTLVLRLDLAGDPSFPELLARVREVTLGAYTHQDLPFERLVEELRPERDLSRNPLFQVAFVLHNLRTEPVHLPGLSLEPFAVESAAPKFDLSLTLVETGRSLRGSLEYRTDLFDASTVERFAGHLGTWLEGAVAAPDQRLSRLPLLTSAERQQIEKWSGAGEAVASPAGSLHELFELQVERAPDAVAVVFEGERLTYGALDQQANRLARRLRRSGVGPDVGVGICLERSLELVAALLAVLKAGGAYVPLDPAFPEERLASLLASASVPVVVTRSRWAATLGSEDLIAICLDERGEDEQGGDDLAVSVTADNLAYILYTSGSTGRPKGVQVTHGNVMRLFTATRTWLSFGETDVWTLFHSYAFDFSVWEIWGALLHGGRLVVVPHWVSRSPEQFRELLLQEGVTVLSQTPSSFRSFLQAERTASVRQPLRWVIFGGEALDPGGLAPWYELYPEERPRLVNMYGITETTVHATCFPLSARDVQGPAGGLIGAPLRDLRLHVLDRGLEPCPIGVPGEIFVGGPGLARGYLDAPGLTAERFLPDPFGGAGERLYRSGDLARRRADGNVEFLGRTDHQVKIRGFRIELGEIEAALTQIPGIQSAVVTVLGSGIDRRLAAYVVAEEASPAAADLRHLIRRKLPDYMVPGVFMRLAALPLTPTGKVDRRSLPAPDQAHPDPEAAWTPPRTPTEERLAAIWREVLDVERIGAHDNFFDLGGHSLLAVRVNARLREVFRLEDFPLQLLFEKPTLSELAFEITRIEVERQENEEEMLRLIDEIQRMAESDAGVQKGQP